MWYNAMFTIHDWEWQPYHTTYKNGDFGDALWHCFPTLFGLGISILVTLPSLVLQIFGKDSRQFRDLLASFFCGPNPDFTDDHPKHETRHFQLQRIHARVTMYD